MAKTVLPRSWFVATSLILGLASFIPVLSDASASLLGVLIGILASIFGIIGLKQIKKWIFIGKKMWISGIILGILGIFFTVVVSWPLTEAQNSLTQKYLTQTYIGLELYKKTKWQYPENLEKMQEDMNFQKILQTHFSWKPTYYWDNGNYFIFTFTDSGWYGKFYYKVSDDWKTFDLRSLGADHEHNTQDDILPSIK